MATLLIRAGVGINTFNFLAQPILKDLANMSFNSKKKGQYRIAADNIANVTAIKNKYKSLASNVALDFPKTQLQDIEDIKNNIFDTEYLIKDIDITTPRDQNFYARQLAILAKFTALNKQAASLNDSVQVSQLDTKKYGSNLTEIRNFVGRLEKTLYDPNLANFEEMLTDTFVGTYLDTALDTLFSIMSDRTITASQGFVELTDKMFELIGNKFVRDAYITNTVSDEAFTSIVSEFFSSKEGMNINKDRLKELFLGNNTVTDRIVNIKADPSYKRLHNNTFLTKLRAVVLEDAFEPKYVVLPNIGSRDKFEKDLITEGWKELLLDSDPKVTALAKDLVAYAFYANGFKKGFHSFFEFVPTDHLEDIGYNDFIKAKLEVLNTQSYASNVSTFGLLDNLFETNWFNDILVPEVTASNIRDAKYSDKYKVDVIFKVSAPSNYYVGTDEDGRYMYSPYIKYKKGESTYLYRYNGYDPETLFPIYRIVSKKGRFSRKGLSMKEYGIQGSIISTNELSALDAQDIAKKAKERSPEYANAILLDSHEIYGIDLYSTSMPDVTNSVADNETTKVLNYDKILKRIKNRTKDNILPC